MIKWLEKVISGRANEAERAGVMSVVTPTSATAASSAEPQLPNPVIKLSNDQPDQIFAHGILSRQVIVDRAYHPVAYEFGLRAESTHTGISTAQILSGVLARLSNTGISAGRQTWLRMREAEIAESLIKTVDCASTVLVIELSDNGFEADTMAQELARFFKTEGVRLALADWNDTERHHAWLPLCHYVEIRNRTHNPLELGNWPEKLKALAPGIRLVACDVDSWEELEFCHRQNFDLFRGHFLTHRENWPRQPKISPERTRLIDLLNRLHLGAELIEVGDQLKLSPELSYRLLRYINSAGVGATSRIGSIQQGLMVLGRDKIYRWLTVLLFTSGQSKSLDSALLEQALVRARLMELMAGDRFSRVQVDEIFIVGIFSLLDMLLRLPMSVALEPLKLPHAVQTALLDTDTLDSVYTPLLKLAVACEDGDRETQKNYAAQLGVSLPHHQLATP